MNERTRKILILFGITAFICLPQMSLLAQQFGRGPGPGPGGGTSTTALTNFETTYFSGSGICAFCHSNLTDSAGNEVSNDAHWRSTMMANSAKDPLWQAKIESEVNRNPDLQVVIEDKCSRCHMGMARYQAITDGTEVGVLNNGFLDVAHPLHEAAMDGVSCALCHQVEADNLGLEESFTGQYSIDVTRLRPDRLIFGPYDFPAINPMNNNTGFIPTSGAQVKEAGLCGACHTLYTPTVAGDGNVVGEFPEQMTYLEWEHSGSDKSCQACHIPEASGPVAISNRPRRLQAREPFGQHHFVGGNSFMVDILKNNQAELGITADIVHLDDTIARTMTQLQGKTATLTFGEPPPSLENGLLTVDVTVSNLAGHKFPSGFPSRRTWLHMVVKDGQNDIIFESGKPDPDNPGQIMGNDADVNGTTFEPHYDEITSEDKVQLYEAVMLDTEGNVTWTLLRAASYAKDNRLLPNGFDKTTAAPDISVNGNAATDDENFQGGRDQVTYVVDTQGASGPFTVTIDLLFQSVSYPFMENLREESDALLIGRFVNQYDKADKLPIVLDTIQQVIP
jgi:hypothetical protein